MKLTVGRPFVEIAPFTWLNIITTMAGLLWPKCCRTV